jgi:hypothetical protein
MGQTSKEHSIPSITLVPQWEWTVPDTRLIGLIASNSRYFAFSHSDPEELICVDRNTGDILWRAANPDGHGATDETYLYLQDRHPSDELRCLDWKTGHQLWHVDLSDQAHIITVPENPGRVLYATVGDRRPELLSAGCLDGSTGNIVWQETAQRSYLGTAHGLMYFAGLNYNPNGVALYRRSPATGRVLPGDPVPIPAVTGAVEDTNLIYLPQQSQYLFYTMIVNTGVECSSFVVADSQFKPLWKQSGTGGYSGPTYPVVYDDVVVFGLKNDEGIMNSIIARHLKAGRTAWSVRLPPTRPGQHNPVIGVWQGVLLHESGDRLLGRSLKDGKPLWSFPLKPGFRWISIAGRQLVIEQSDASGHSWHISVYDHGIPLQTGGKQEIPANRSQDEIKLD